MIISLAILGIFIGFISGFFGVGGGALLVPILLYFGFDIKDAIGISVAQMTFSSIFGSYLNYKRGALKISKTIFIGIGGFVGGLGSGFVVSALSSKTLTIIFFITIVFAIIRFFKASAIPHKEPIENVWLFFIIGVFIGVISMSIGIGGALFLTPILVGFLHFDIKKAISASLFFVVFASVAGLISLSFYGYVDFKYGFILGILSLFGVYLGINAGAKINAKKHKNLVLLLEFVVLCLILNKLIFGS